MLDVARSPAILTDVFESTFLIYTLLFLAGSWFIFLVLRRANLVPGYVTISGPFVTIRSVRGQDFLTRLARPRRFWRAWSNFGIGLSIIAMVLMFVMFLASAVLTIQQPEPTGIQQPQNLLVIPGLNEFLPLSAAPGIIFGLLVGLVIHEGGHGLLCRVEDIEINSVGVFLLSIIPMGAFVEPEEQSSKAASRGAKTRMFAAGLTNNFIATVVAFVLLFWLVGGAITLAPGAAVGAVHPNSPAEAAEIEPNDRITAIDDEEIRDNDHFVEVLEANDAERIEVELNDGERTATVDRAPYVAVSVPGGPTGLDLEDRVVAVDGEPVATEAAVREAVANESSANLTVASPAGERSNETIPIGAALQILEDGPLAEAGAPEGDFFVVTAADGTPITDAAELRSLLEKYDRGDTIEFEGYLDGERRTFEVTYEEGPQFSEGIIDGISGLVFSDLGVQLYPADTFLSVMSNGEMDELGPLGQSIWGVMMLAFMLPVMVIYGFQFNFAGFSGGVQNFYEVSGAFAVLGDGTVFLIANMLFWTAWMNLALGMFNCIPTFPLDGGHILRSSTEAIFSRLPGIDATRGMVRTVTTLVGLSMLVSLLLMLFGPWVLTG